jgi:hypothetical protein
MPLGATSTINTKRTRTVLYRSAAGKTYNAVIRAITGATLTLWIPSTRQLLTTVAKATTAEGTGFHHRPPV